MSGFDTKNASTICKLRIKRSDLKRILALMDKPTTQAVRIKVSMPLKYKNQTFQCVWANEFGRTLISLIAQLRTQAPLTISELQGIPGLEIFPSPDSLRFKTLSIGVKKLAIAVSVESYRCSPPGKQTVFNFLLYQLYKIGGENNWRLCRYRNNYEYYSDISECCSVRGYEKNTFCTNHVSYNIVKYVREYITVMTTIIVILGIPLLLKFVRSFREERKYYQRPDSPMALSSILRSLLVEEKGSVVSAQRRLLFSAIVTTILYVSEWMLLWAFIALVWIIPFTALDFFGTRPGVIDEDMASCFPSQTYTYNIYVKLLALPFNIKYWRKIYNSCFKRDYQLTRNQDLPSSKKICLFFEDLFFIFLYLIFFIFICFFDLLFLILLWFLYLAFPPISLYKGSFPLIPILWVVLSLFLIIPSLICLLSMAFFFLAGLYLNGEYYSPIVAPTMLFVFYAWKCWRSCVEAKYANLKSSIYEVCEELANGNCNNVLTENVSIGSMVDVNDGPFTLDVRTGAMSKALYETIRETYLPYDDVLFSFFVRLFVVTNFCLFLSVIVLFCQSSGISGELQVISTMAIGILPFIFDIIWADDSLGDQADKKLKLMLGQTINFERMTSNVIYVSVTSEERNVLIF
jgi:hypothetical protein